MPADAPPLFVSFFFSVIFMVRVGRASPDFPILFFSVSPCLCLFSSKAPHVAMHKLMTLK
jgi:hypothetical protein